MAKDATAQTDGAERRHGSFLPVGSLRTKAGTWLGLALMLAWIDLLFCFEGVLRDREVMKGGLVHDPVFLCATIAASVALLACAVLAKTGRVGVLERLGAFSRRPVLLVFCLVGAVGAAGAVLLTELAPTSPTFLSVLAGLGVGVCIAWSTLAWGRHLSLLDLREALVLVSAAACLQWLPFIILAWLPFPVRVALVILAPLVSGHLLYCADANEGDASEGDVGTLPQHRSARSFGKPTDMETGGRHDLARLALAIAVFSFVTQFVWCYFIKLLPGRLDISLFPAVFAAVVLASATAVLLCARAMQKRGAYRLELYYRVMFACCLCGVTATGVAATNVPMAELFASYALVYIGYSLIGPTMWMLALGYAHMRRAEPIGVVGPVFAGQYLGMCSGFAVVEALARMGGPSAGQQAMPWTVLALTVLLALAYVAVFPERNLLSLSPLLFGMSHESVRQRCAAVAREHGLTARETEVLTLLARGRDVGYICEQLSITRNTANAHRKNIYAKLGIHSQQELLTAVEEAQI